MGAGSSSGPTLRALRAARPPALVLLGEDARAGVGEPAVAAGSGDAVVWDEVVQRTVDNNGVRPVAFVARNSHASYPDVCFGNCRQEVGSLPRPATTGDPVGSQPRLRRLPSPLPIDEDGNEASWNAFPGRWGSQECILAGAYCDLSPAPRGPSFQTRYDEPTDDGEWICILGTGSGGSFRLGRCSQR